MLKGKKILLGITGSIAAYKSAVLVRLLVKSGAEVKVIMTPAAAGFISPLTLSTLSKNEVLSGLAENSTWANHVMLGRWADLMLMAPLSCNTLAKMANGLCDNLLLAVYLSATCPVVAAPAMDEDMWHHPSTNMNIQKILSFGNHMIPVENGELASGLNGEGRMAEPENILKWLEGFFLLCMAAGIITYFRSPRLLCPACSANACSQIDRYCPECGGSHLTGRSFLFGCRCSDCGKQLKRDYTVHFCTTCGAYLHEKGFRVTSKTGNI